MSIISALADHITDTIGQAVPDLHVTTDAATIKPALAARQTVAWVGAPERIEMDARDVGVCEWKAALISPDHSNHIKGLDDLTQVALVLRNLLGITEMEPDTATPGAGPTFPALFITFENSFTLED
ncbi:hypothetical protein [Schaalia vaccimaxillae]|uniref:hypothetical protein n=1 Tax=Schaalia vaccimaxillae TaxID=183916 RepID=UPI0003B685CC|nr:hypothetical protein [Schaalia vaccimaxillae]